MAKVKSTKSKTSKAKAPVKKVAKAPKEKAVKAKKVAKVASVPMTENADEKQKVIESYAQGKGDTGSPEVQVALLSYKITRLTGHLEENKKDNHSRRGLLKVIAKRRRILNYLNDLDKDRYKGLIEKLGLKK